MGTCSSISTPTAVPRSTWLQRASTARFERKPHLMALSGNYRFYDWDWWGRTLLRAYDFTLGPGTQLLVKYLLRIGVVFYGGNFAVRQRGAWSGSAVSTRRSSFMARTRTSGGAYSPSVRVELAYDCYLFTSARRYQRDGQECRVPSATCEISSLKFSITAPRTRGTGDVRH